MLDETKLSTIQQVLGIWFVEAATLNQEDELARTKTQAAMFGMALAVAKCNPELADLLLMEIIDGNDDTKDFIDMMAKVLEEGCMEAIRSA